MSEERAKAAFDVRALTLLLDGGDKATEVGTRWKCVKISSINYSMLSVERKDYARTWKRSFIQDGWHPRYQQIRITW
jgi:hypothetical protein